MIPALEVMPEWSVRALRLRQARIDQGLSLATMAARMTITVSELGALEAGNFQYFDSAQKVVGLLEKCESILGSSTAASAPFIPKFLRN